MAEFAGYKVAIIATDMFEESELTEPRDALQEAGAEVAILSPHGGEIQGAQHDEKTVKVTVDKLISEVNPDDFDAVMLPGGTMNADILRVDEDAQAFVQSFDEDGKPIAAICHAPWLLVSAGLVKGRRLTSFHTLADDVKNAGGNWEDRPVVTDSNWVTSRKPDDIPAFNQAMLDLFSGQ